MLPENSNHASTVSMIPSCLLLSCLLASSKANTCLNGRSAWNEDQISISVQLAGWLESVFTGEKGVQSRLHHPVPGVEATHHNQNEERRLITIGTFTKNIPHDLTWQTRSMRRLDGFLYGQVDLKGMFTGDDVTFIYPDLITGLRGTFVNGVLLKARAVDVVGERCKDGKKELKLQPSAKDSGIVWKKHETNADYIGQHPRVMDPHERKSVYVAGSWLDEAGEGLFSRRIFSPGDLISYYSGQKTYLETILHQHNMSDWDIVDAASYLYRIGQHAPAWWDYPRDLLLDVGSKYRSTSTYRTSLAHKANHKFGGSNAYWDMVHHPVVGGIACLVAYREIDEDDEVYVDYNYDMEEWVPAWYTEGLNNYVMEYSLREEYPEV